ncbi:hypothetical protein DFQ28_000676 [Apophysomyces sp. BC1034]|nr:hypothetical protein DFQ28_000676 [Apophysomyces sp. BC1034]
MELVKFETYTIMWHEARANEKRIKELMVDHKKRAERRRAYYDSKIGDPHQLLRVTGSATKLYPDAEQFYYHENTNNLMPWQGDPDVRIDRFDGRSLLDYIPESNSRARNEQSQEDRDLADDLNFARYHDLVEAERLNVTEKERLEEVEEEWTKLLDRHKALLAMLNSKKNEASHSYAYDYGNTVHDDLDNDEESQLLRDILFFLSFSRLIYVDDLTDKDRQILNDMAKKYSIRNYSRLLRLAKKDRDDQLRELKAQQKGHEVKSKEGHRRGRDDRRRRRRNKYDADYRSKRGGRESPSYEPYRNDSDSESSGEEPESSSDFVIEFGSGPSTSANTEVDKDNLVSTTTSKKKHADNTKASENSMSEQALEGKKLTPMEKLKLKMRAGLERQIRSDEHDKLRKEREREMDLLQTYAKSQTIPVAPSFVRPPLPRRQNNDDTPIAERDSPAARRSISPTHTRSRQYRSPSSSRSRSPARDRHEQSNNKESPRATSPKEQVNISGPQMMSSQVTHPREIVADVTAHLMSHDPGHRKETDTALPAVYPDPDPDLLDIAIDVADHLVFRDRHDDATNDIVRQVLRDLEAQVVEVDGKTNVPETTNLGQNVTIEDDNLDIYKLLKLIDKSYYDVNLSINAQI